MFTKSTQNVEGTGSACLTPGRYGIPRKQEVHIRRTWCLVYIDEAACCCKKRSAYLLRYRWYT